MLARYVHNLVRSQLNKRAVRSLEYGMIVMMVAIASVGAVNSIGPHVAATTLVQLASAK